MPSQTQHQPLAPHPSAASPFLERSLAEPDRIVGELLQPGGVVALLSLGLGACLEGIDAVPVHGYAVFDAGGTVHIPYPSHAEGRSFHHGRFVQNLRAYARAAPGVDLLEATVTDLIECPPTRRVLGVQARRNGAEHKEMFFAALIVVADGCFSNFRSAWMVARSASAQWCAAILLVLEDVTVALVKGHGPVLLSPILDRGTRYPHPHRHRHQEPPPGRYQSKHTGYLRTHMRSLLYV
jgi:squalene monooxygenase